MVLAKLIKKNIKRANICTMEQMSMIDFLKMLVETWEEHVTNKSIILRVTKENKATRGFVKTGLAPFYYDCENWKKSIQFYAELSRLENNVPKLMVLL